MTDTTRSVIRLPAREIPVPVGLSPQAQALLARGPMELAAYPADDDADGWR
jgi:monoterpene epsilon-lactone hydrolase